jgi:D-amino-acid dehydrogenase
MKVAVIGAGIIGVTTAYELGADGHEVTVFERRGSVAAETSFANAGLVAPGYVTPWAAPGMPGKVLSHLFSKHTPVRVHATLDPATIGWMWRWWRACRVRTYQANRLRMQRLAYFSREQLHRLTRDLKLDYERSDGYLVLLRTAKDLAMVQPGLASLAALETRFETLDSDQCRAVEPGLSLETELHAGIYLPDDEVGNCRQFANLLRNEAQRHGVRFRFHTQVRRIVPGRRPQLVTMYSPPDEATVLNVALDGGSADAQDTQPLPMQALTEDFDAIVVCAALDSRSLLRPLGLRLPMQAIHGYSVTAPLRRNEGLYDQGPQSALMDERYKVAISRLGARIRVAGSAEIGGSVRRHNTAALETLYKVLHDWFPGSARLSQAQVWKGARPMLPDGPPVLGASGVDGVWLNLGHGSSGWALSCGSARLLADSIARRPTAIDIEGLGIERLSS